MSRVVSNAPVFESGSLVPAVTYLLIIVVLSGFALVSTGSSPSPVLGMAWGAFLIVVGLTALTVESVSFRSLLPPVRSFVPFWAFSSRSGHSTTSLHTVSDLSECRDSISLHRELSLTPSCIWQHSAVPSCSPLFQKNSSFAHISSRKQSRSLRAVTDVQSPSASRLE